MSHVINGGKFCFSHSQGTYSFGHQRGKRLAFEGVGCVRFEGGGGAGEKTEKNSFRTCIYCCDELGDQSQSQNLGDKAGCNHLRLTSSFMSGMHLFHALFNMLGATTAHHTFFAKCVNLHTPTYYMCMHALISCVEGLRKCGTSQRLSGSRPPVGISYTCA